MEKFKKEKHNVSQGSEEKEKFHNGTIENESLQWSWQIIQWSRAPTVPPENLGSIWVFTW